MEVRELSTIGRRYYALRGLLLIPAGWLLIAAGVFDMPPIGDEPVSDDAALFVLAAVAAALGYLACNHYYVSRFGRVVPSTTTAARVAIFTVVSAMAIAVGIFVDTQYDLPITVCGALFAFGQLVYYATVARLRAYHWVIFGVLGLLSVAPIWGDVDDKVSLVMIPMGVATIGVGAFDHTDLMRSLRPRSAILAD